MSDESFDTVLMNRCVERWQAGDRDAADEMLRRTGARLDHLARKMVRGFPNVRRWADTADVLQGATLRLLNTLRNLRPATTRDFFNLAAVHIRRELLDLARHYGVKGHDQLAPDHDVCDQHSEDGAHDELEIWCRFHAAVEGLDSEQREIVSLVFYHGWTQGQIAELFGVNERTVRRRWVAACGKLHEVLGGQFPEGV